MYSKQEVSKLRQEFWTTFGLYLAPVLSAEGVKINWVNYKTGEKHIHFRMHADNRSAYIGIELTHSDAGIRQLFFDQFLQLKNILEETIGERWEWVAAVADEHGKEISSIYKETTGVNILDKGSWPLLISFFKSRIVALDTFWTDARYFFEALR